MPKFDAPQMAPQAAAVSHVTLKVAKLPLQQAVQLLRAFDGSTLQAEDFAGTVLRLAGQKQSAAGLLDAPDAAASQQVGPEDISTLHALANQLAAQGKLPQAEALARMSVDALKARFGLHDAHTLRAHNSLACLLQNQGKYAEARQLYLHAIEAQRRLLGTQHPDTVATLENLATLLYETDEFEHAAALLHEVVNLRRRLLGDAHPDTLRSYNNLALVLQKQGALAQAEQILRQSLLVQRRILGESHPETLTTISNLATVLEDLQHFEPAEALHRQALADRQVHLGHAHIDALTSANNLAAYFMQQKRFDEALDLLRDSVTLATKTLPMHHFFVGNLRMRLGACMSALGQHEAAEDHLMGGYQALKEALGGMHPRTQRAAWALAQLYER